MKPEKPIIIAVDGPAGSGKSSICAHVCEHLSWHHFNTGRLYRAVAAVAHREGQHGDWGKETYVRAAHIYSNEGTWKAGRLWVNGEDLSDALHTPDADEGASKAGGLAEVRQILLPQQRELALSRKEAGVMLDGRDIATVVFPEADCKIFLTASLEQRARRRLSQQHGQIEAKLMNKVMQELKLRDERDAGRAIAPLKKADDALEIDSSEMSFDEVVASILSLFKRKKFF